jgi:hypothetical protein
MVEARCLQIQEDIFSTIEARKQAVARVLEGVIRADTDIK